MPYPPPDPDRPPTLVAVPTTPPPRGDPSGEALGRPGASAHASYRRRRAAE